MSGGCPPASEFLNRITGYYWHIHQQAEGNNQVSDGDF